MKKKRLSDEKLLEIIHKAFDEYEGDVTVLESAIGALVLGREVGWHGVRVVHSSRTFKKYEEKLGVEFREVLPERGEAHQRLTGIRLADQIGKFWQAISSGMVSGREARELEAK